MTCECGATFSKCWNMAHIALVNQFLIEIAQKTGNLPTNQSKDFWIAHVTVKSWVISYTNNTVKML